MKILNINHERVDLVNTEAHYIVEFIDFKLNFYYKPGIVKKALVFSPGFINRAQFQHPYFQRIKWLQTFDTYGISLADPTLDLDPGIGIGWFVGTKRTHYLACIAEFISRLLANLEIPNESTLFFGSSAGGFSSMAFAAFIRGACAFAINPQTNLARFHELRELNLIGKHCFGSTSVSAWSTIWMSRIDLVTIMKICENVPRSLIWQNKFDEYHVFQHLMPFLEGVNRLPLKCELSVEIVSVEEFGHNPPPLPFLIGHFTRIILNWL
jgi:hypothetical protein